MLDGVEHPVNCIIFATRFEGGTEYSKRAGFSLRGANARTSKIISPMGHAHCMASMFALSQLGQHGFKSGMTDMLSDKPSISSALWRLSANWQPTGSKQSRRGRRLKQDHNGKVAGYARLRRLMLAELFKRGRQYLAAVWSRTFMVADPLRLVPRWPSSARRRQWTDWRRARLDLRTRVHSRLVKARVTGA